MPWPKKILLIAEVIILFLAGALISRYLSTVLGIREWLLQVSELVEPGEVDFIGIAEREFVRNSLKYGIVFLLVVLFLRLYRRKVSTYLSFSTNGKSFTYLFKVALLLLCFGGLIPKLFMGLWRWGWVGDGPIGWQLLNEQWDASFWLYSLVTAIVIPPLVEEFFFRGYAQRRFQDGFSVGFSIVLMALMFAGFHTQYFEGSLISIQNLIMLFVTSLSLGYSRYYTGSLWPGILAHAMVNIAIIGVPALILSGAMAVYLMLNFKTIQRHTRLFFSLFRSGSR